MAVDATLEGIENLLNARTWGSVYSFLINKDGETVVHPRLKPSAEVHQRATHLCAYLIFSFLAHRRSRLSEN